MDSRSPGFGLVLCVLLVLGCRVPTAVAATNPASIPLVVTEVMYHPIALSGSSNDAELYEFVELRNVGNTPLDLVGFRVGGGIEYTFTSTSGVKTLAAGAYVLVVRNRAAFSQKYPGVTAVAGEYLGALNNAGDELILETPLLETILAFTYDDAWFPVTDGLGFSLVIRDDRGAPDNWGVASSWRPSSVVDGSPGREDTPPPGTPTVWVNETLTHTDPPLLDAVELFNPGTTPADIGGWFLSDDFAEPQKYAFPASTRIPAGGYLVVTELDFNTGPAPFTFSSLGEEVHLFSARNGQLTGYSHGFEFGASANGVSFGRHVTSTGEERFVAQTERTFGVANSLPRVGPMVISEIMFEPPLAGATNNVLDEFIELENILDAPAPLFDPLFPTNAWKLDAGVQFTFPTNLSLPPRGHLLVVNFNPVTNTTQLAQFRSRYAVAETTPVLGPYQGNLANGGERVSLLKPDPPQTAISEDPGFVPYVLVDEVQYRPESPWPPGAAGTGQSLQRIDASRYADDPANWRVGNPTAGRDNATSPDDDRDNDGLPNDWETANGLDPDNATGDNGATGDPDHDDMPNLDEYAAGTHPRDAASRLVMLGVEVSDVETLVRFLGVAGRSYSVLFSTDPSTGPWQRLANANPSADGAVSVRDPAHSVGRFYRVVTPALP